MISTEKLAEEVKHKELANYISAYHSSMADNLVKLANGNLDFNIEISPSSKKNLISPAIVPRHQ